MLIPVVVERQKRSRVTDLTHESGRNGQRDYRHYQQGGIELSNHGLELLVVEFETSN